MGDYRARESGPKAWSIWESHMAAKGQHSTCRKWDLLSVCGIVKHLGLWPTGIMALGLQTRLSQMGPQPQYPGRKTGQPSY